MSLITPIAIVVLVIFFLSAALRILNEYERGVIFRLGRVIKAKGPGLIILIPLIDKMVKVACAWWQWMWIPRTLSPGTMSRSR